ncbi:ATP synthase F1 subunit epsilon [Helicobacter mustelae]|uniref:ATP synthase epsilon chain n=1 Tax=Helicobacter mustelae (strain ATCC 43772 / CCUG 25715 / CIP 103759 / LMG 18044 / NCTC 12198 / R85-136P) TaxID=679897 RepID=D3UGS7_HELM1|nr:ATP synthase F1 subunit epsilon [Helicobacter mustelae]CBG39698.1 ATP synthase F1 sector epsilon subunit [Helicobacter mustelae 12198]SQH71204.1 ATP synthase F1 sector subunit epsilon [Helicobacter mustelae]STP12331.1 ATP synthase F1 sector subunit epsilon [Helicobacter mustelae]
MALTVNIIAPYGKIFSGGVDGIILPGSEGEFGVLEGHSELFALLKTGVIEISRNQQKDLIAINWGYAKVQPENVDVLVDGAVLISDSKGDIAGAISNAQKLLEEATTDKVALSSVMSKIENVAKGK